MSTSTETQQSINMDDVLKNSQLTIDRISKIRDLANLSLVNLLNIKEPVRLHTLWQAFICKPLRYGCPYCSKELVFEILQDPRRFGPTGNPLKPIYYFHCDCGYEYAYWGGI